MLTQRALKLPVLTEPPPAGRSGLAFFGIVRTGGGAVGPENQGAAIRVSPGIGQLSGLLGVEALWRHLGIRMASLVSSQTRIVRYSMGQVSTLPWRED